MPVPDPRARRRVGGINPARAELETLQGRMAELERDLAEVRQLVPDLEEIVTRRRRSQQVRLWLAERVPRPVRRLASQVAPILAAGLTMYGVEHGWVHAITRYVFGH